MKPRSSYPSCRAGLICLALPLVLALGACDVSDDPMVKSRIPVDDSDVARIRNAANDPSAAKAGAPMAAAPAPAAGAAPPPPAPPAAAPAAPGAAPAAPPAAVVAAAAAPAPASGHDPAAGKPLYAIYCASCHGAGGAGDGPAAAALNPRPTRHTDGGYMNPLSNDHLYKVIDKGGTAVGKSALMTPWGGVLSPDQIWDVAAFVRSLAQPSYSGPMP